jgi:hypothetical protein
MGLEQLEHFGDVVSPLEVPEVDFFASEKNFKLDDGPLVMRKGLKGTSMGKFWGSEAFQSGMVPPTLHFACIPIVFVQQSDTIS